MWFRIRMDLHWSLLSGSGSRRPKITLKNIETSEEISCFAVLDVLFWGLKASPTAWSPSYSPRNKKSSIFWFEKSKDCFQRLNCIMFDNLVLRIDPKCLIQIRIEPNADPQHCFSTVEDFFRTKTVFLSKIISCTGWYLCLPGSRIPNLIRHTNAAPQHWWNLKRFFLVGRASAGVRAARRWAVPGAGGGGRGGPPSLHPRAGPPTRHHRRQPHPPHRDHRGPAPHTRQVPPLGGRVRKNPGFLFKKPSPVVFFWFFLRFFFFFFFWVFWVFYIYLPRNESF